MKAKHLIFAIVLVATAKAEYHLAARQKLKFVHLRREMPFLSPTAESTCDCTTVYSTLTGEGTLYFPPTPITSEPIAQPTYEPPLAEETTNAAICPPPYTVNVIETNYITVDPIPTQYVGAPTPVTPPIVEESPTDQDQDQNLPIPAPAPETEPELAPKPAPAPEPAPKPDMLGSTTGLWAITFSPFNDDGKCKSAETIWEDVRMIRLAGFKAIRVYGTECSGIENISSAASFHGMKLIIGIFIGESGCSGAAEQVTHITKWAKWEIVELVVIGNEALFSGHASIEELTSFISSTKATLRSAGYQGPCTTAEPLNIWQKDFGALCGIVDIVGCNIHPFFNPEVDASHAGPFVKSQLEIVEKICPGKHGINLECGWPSAGECNGKACPGKAEQEAAVASIQQFAGNSSVMFTYSDDHWKAPGAFKVEQSFGLIKMLTSH